MKRTFLALALLGATATISGAYAQASGTEAMANPKGSMATWTPSAEAAYAKSAIQSAGYNSVGDLMRTADGAWHATAVKNNAKINVVLDRSGRVSTN